jgi:hypothetical protein
LRYNVGDVRHGPVRECGALHAPPPLLCRPPLTRFRSHSGSTTAGIGRPPDRSSDGVALERPVCSADTPGPGVARRVRNLGTGRLRGGPVAIDLRLVRTLRHLPNAPVNLYPRSRRRGLRRSGRVVKETTTSANVRNMRRPTGRSRRPPLWSRHRMMTQTAAYGAVHA